MEEEVSQGAGPLADGETIQSVTTMKGMLFPLGPLAAFAYGDEEMYRASEITRLNA